MTHDMSRFFLRKSEQSVDNLRFVCFGAPCKRTKVIIMLRTSDIPFPPQPTSNDCSDPLSH
jgi:hypothetical protein